MKGILLLVSIFIGHVHADSCVYPNKRYDGAEKKYHHVVKEFPLCRDDCIENPDCVAIYFMEEGNKCFMINDTFDPSKLKVTPHPPAPAGGTVFRKNCDDVLYSGSKTLTCSLKDCQCLENGPWRCLGQDFTDVDIDDLIIPEKLVFYNGINIDRLLNAGIFKRTNMKKFDMQQPDGVSALTTDFFTDNHWEYLFVSIKGLNMGENRGPCTDGACFTSCGELPYLDKQTELTGTLYTLKYDERTIPSGVKQIFGMFVNVHSLTIDQELTIVAREVRSDSEVDGGICTLTVYMTEYGTLFKLALNKLTILAQDIRFDVSTCKVTHKKIENSIDASDQVTSSDGWASKQYIRAVSFCAKMINERSNEDAEADTILDWLLTFANAGTHKVSGTLIEELLSVRSGFQDARNGVHYVPNLSTELIGQVLDLQQEEAEKYSEMYSEFERNEKKDTDGAMILLKALSNQARNLEKSNEVGLQQLIDAYTQSVLGTDNLYGRFYDVQQEMEYQENILTIGLALETTNVVIDAGLSVFKWLTLDFTASKAAADTAADLVKLGVRIAGMVKTINRVKAATKDHDYASLNDAKNYVNDLDKAAELTERLLDWRKMAKNFHILLSQGLAATLIGSGKYQQLLQEWCLYGETLTRETIRQIQLLREITAEKAAIKARVGSKRYMNYLLKTIHAKESRSHQQNEMLYQTIIAELYEVKWALSTGLESYCQTYFYYHFEDCGVKPLVSDTIKDLSSKINQAKINYLSALAFTGSSQTVQKAVIKIQDPDECPDDTQPICPIAIFKRDKVLTYHVTLDETELRDYDRVRLNEIKVKIKGVTLSDPKDKIYIDITNAGNFQDRFERSTYNFTSVPFHMVYRYSPGNNANCKYENHRYRGRAGHIRYANTAAKCFSACNKQRTCKGAQYAQKRCQHFAVVKPRKIRPEDGFTFFRKQCRPKREIFLRARVADGNKDNFKETSPFTTWILTVNDPDNKVDVSLVTSIDLIFQGEAKPNRMRVKKK